MNKNSVLQIRNLTTTYTSQQGVIRAVNQVNLNLDKGKILGLVGESGCGKSTILLSIMGLIRQPGAVAEGEILFKSADLRLLPKRDMQAIRGKEIAMIFQDPLSTLNPVFPVGEQIEETLRLHHLEEQPGFLWPFKSRARQREKVIKVMEEVGIASSRSRYSAFPHQFSGGMQQRVLIAIALAGNPTLLLADEPTTALDVTIQAQILDLMRKINKDHGTSIILVTHDLGVAAEFCDTIAVMYAGRIVEKGAVDQVIHQPEHPYTRGLLACRPRIVLPKVPIAPIPGSVPDLVHMPQGCPFDARCELVQDVCQEGPIPLIEITPGHTSRCLRHFGFQRESDWTWADRIEVEKETLN